MAYSIFGHDHLAKISKFCQDKASQMPNLVTLYVSVIKQFPFQSYEGSNPEFFFKKVGHYRPLFIYFCLFITVDSKQNFNIILPMTGFESRTSGLEGAALPTEPQPLPRILLAK